jgi:hypothetical protein
VADRIAAPICVQTWIFAGLERKPEFPKSGVLTRRDRKRVKGYLGEALCPQRRGRAISPAGRRRRKSRVASARRHASSHCCRVDLFGEDLLCWLMKRTSISCAVILILSKSTSQIINSSTHSQIKCTAIQPKSLIRILIIKCSVTKVEVDAIATNARLLTREAVDN